MSCVAYDTELVLLNNLYQRPDAQFLALHSRRRISKITLVTWWGKGLLEPYLYWMAS
jgi:hypothetical protein